MSSKLRDPMQVVTALNDETAVIVYDWKLTSLRDLVSYVKEVIRHSRSGSKVLSIAVIAPASTGGCVSLLEGYTTTAQSLQAQPDLLQFWRVLAGCVQADAESNGGRVDFLGCRLLDNPTAAAQLLRKLWDETDTAFTASDDPLAGYPLSTFTIDAVTNTLRLVSSMDVTAVDIYFHRATLEATWSSVEWNPSAPGTPGTPPGHAYLSDAAEALPIRTHGHTGWPAHAAAGPGRAASLSPPRSASTPTRSQVAPLSAGRTARLDIFSTFFDALRDARRTFADACDRFQDPSTGVVKVPECVAMVHALVPDMEKREAAHIRLFLIAAERRQGTTVEDLQAVFAHGLLLHQQMQRVLQKHGTTPSPDDFGILPVFRNYFMQNNEAIGKVFEMFDRDKDGHLDASEVHKVITNIPNLTADDHMLLLTYLYECDVNGDGFLSFQEFHACFATDKLPGSADI